MLCGLPLLEKPSVLEVQRKKVPPGIKTKLKEIRATLQGEGMIFPHLPFWIILKVISVRAGVKRNDP